MDGPSSDAENETIIATTTYITLSGTHTTESEVFGSSSSSSASASLLSSKKPEQPLQHYHQHQNKTPILNKQTFIETPIEIPDELTDINILVENEDDVENVAEEIDTDTSSSPRSATVIRPKNSLIFYHKIKEKAREAECCNIPTIIMDPILAERQRQLERNAISSIAALPINPSSTIQIQGSDPRPNRLRLVLRRIGRGLMVCLQMNKDCIFCLMFFIGFILCATMLTIFFYKAMTTLNPATFQYPAIPMGRIYYL